MKVKDVRNLSSRLDLQLQKASGHHHVLRRSIFLFTVTNELYLCNHSLI